MNVIKNIGRHRILASVLFLGMAAGAVQAFAGAEVGSDISQEPVRVGAQDQDEAATQADKQGEESAGKVYVLVNGRPITVREYNQRLIYTLKNRYYHGKVPEGKEEETRKELTDEMVNHLLLLEEAEKRGFKPDEARIDQAIASEEARNRFKPAWQQERERLVAQLRTLAGQKSILDQLEAAVKNVPSPTAAEVRAYYDQHLDLFTEPEKLHLSLILLKVDPSSPVSVWLERLADARGVIRQLEGGADFAEMARKYSGDKSAKNGGDLGYLHRGMLQQVMHDEVDKLKTDGELSVPIKGLEGYSIFRLEHRIPPSKMEFKQVEQRAGDLLVRERRDQAWKANLERLRSAAKIEVVTKPIAVPPSLNSGRGN